MEQWLSTLPKSIVAIGAILLGTALIVLFDPPRTVCDTQFGLFREAQKHFLYSSEVNGITRDPEIKRLTALCKKANGPGGCMELFMGLRKLTSDLDDIPDRCTSDAGNISEIKNGVLGSLDLIVRLAWGAQEPVSYTERNGWLNSADIAIFCKLQATAVRLYGAESWSGTREKTMNELPHKAELSREHIWQRSILSSPCGHYQ